MSTSPTVQVVSKANSPLAFMGNSWQRKHKLQLMDQKTRETSFSQISDEQLEAYNGASIAGNADFGESLELGRILMHFYTNGKLSSDYNLQLKAYSQVLAPRVTGPRPPLNRRGPTSINPTGELCLGLARVRNGEKVVHARKAGEVEKVENSRAGPGTASANGTINLWIHYLTFGNLRQDPDLLFGKSCPKYICHHYEWVP